jgi:hypothetical protein
MVYFDKIVTFVHYYDPVCCKLMPEISLLESVFDIHRNHSPKTHLVQIFL